MALPESMTQHQDDRLPGLPIHFGVTERDDVDGLVVLMPSALSPEREDRQRLYYTRGRWADEWAHAEVMCFPDPALQQDPRLNGAWFMHPDHDVIKAIASIVTDWAAGYEIPSDRIVFYGSSLGGFGAIGAAAHIPGARAVAEVPQIDFAKWLPTAVKEVEEYITGMPISEYRKLHPEQVSLQKRLLKAGRIPEFTILTNPQDFRIREQRLFYTWAQRCSIPKAGPFTFIESTRTSGHSVLKKSDLVPFIVP